MPILDYIRAFWPVLTGLTPIAIAAVVLWLRSQFASKQEAATKASLLSVEDRTVSLLERIDARLERGDRNFEDHSRRIALLEQASREKPSRHELAQDITLLLARMSRVEAEIQGVGRQLGTTNDYLSTLVERGLDRA